VNKHFPFRVGMKIAGPVSVIFGLVALTHLVRVLGQRSINVDGWNVPMGLSYFGIRSIERRGILGGVSHLKILS
jgi:hypothetical protein